ncbi:MAG TPA: T9SS type A sorting domain-containing protein [Bacteroidales bacterium]|mgnify:CR=1 FL=1|nr:T9SS type A sorting domain-containing protein [Bacteroidales bacterium]
MRKSYLQIISFLFLLIPCLSVSAQPPIQWQKSLGGSNQDRAYSVQQTSDGGYIVAGNARSTDGDLTGVSYTNKYWVVKLNNLGTIEWQKTFGGLGADNAYSVQQTIDGGYIVAGESETNGLDVTGNHGYDFWVVKLDDLGTLQWQKALGGSSYDEARSVRQTSDKGYIIAGYSYSTDGDVTGNHGSTDAWVTKLDSLGTLQWQKALGGNDSEYGWSIQQTSDGGYILAASTFSDNNGNVPQNNMGNYYITSDCWLVKLYSTGNIQWSFCLGDSSDNYAFSAQQTADGGFVVAGTNGPTDNNISGNHGGEDYWVVKLSVALNIEWEKSFGGSSDDEAYSVQQTSDGGYIVAGYSNSNDGDVTGNHGSWDCWLVKLDSAGTLQWQRSFGGTGWEQAWSVRQTSDGGCVFAGFSASNDGDVSGNHLGSDDYWVVKLGNIITDIDNTKIHENISIYPNPATTMINIRLNRNTTGTFYNIKDIYGQIILTGQLMNENSEIDISGLTNGLYLISICENFKQTFKIIKQ